MNETIRNICERRSIRGFCSQEIPQDVLDRIITAGTYAATGRGRQSPVILAVTQKALRDRLSEINREILGSDNDPFYGAPVVLVVLARRDIPTYLYDGSLVMGNLMLAAQSEGVGSCWIHRAKETFDTTEGKKLLKELGIEGDYEGIGNCVLGYPIDTPPEPQPRKEDYVYYIK